MKTVITGGSNGIGLAIAQTMSNQDVYSLDLQEPAEWLPWLTHVRTDVTSTEDLQKAFQKIGPGITCLIVNAGVMRRADLFESSETDFDLLFDVNVKGAWLTIKQALPFLTNNATIVQMSSGHALDPPLNPGLYAWTKMTLASLVEMLRHHYPDLTIKAIYPGPVDTDLGRYGLTDAEVADKQKIMHSTEYVAGWIKTLIEAPEALDLKFDAKTRDYTITTPTTVPSGAWYAS